MTLKGFLKLLWENSNDSKKNNNNVTYNNALYLFAIQFLLIFTEVINTFNIKLFRIFAKFEVSINQFNVHRS